MGTKVVAVLLLVLAILGGCAEQQVAPNVSSTKTRMTVSDYSDSAEAARESAAAARAKGLEKAAQRWDKIAENWERLAEGRKNREGGAQSTKPVRSHHAGVQESMKSERRQKEEQTQETLQIKTDGVHEKGFKKGQFTLTSGNEYIGGILSGKPHGPGKIMLQGVYWDNCWNLGKEVPQAECPTPERIAELEGMEERVRKFDEWTSSRRRVRTKSTIVLKATGQLPFAEYYRRKRPIKTLTFPDGRVYEGETTPVGSEKKEVPHFKGEMRYPNGDRYEGSFEEGFFSGGCYYWVSGSRYCGEWKNGKRHGKGAIYAKSSEMPLHGLWEDDVFIGPDPTEQNVDKRTYCDKNPGTCKLALGIMALGLIFQGAGESGTAPSNPEWDRTLRELDKAHQCKELYETCCAMCSTQSEKWDQPISTPRKRCMNRCKDIKKGCPDM